MKAYEVMGDNRWALTRWWHRRTIVSDPMEGHFLMRTQVRFCLRDRLLLLLGRDLKLTFRSDVEPRADNENMAAVMNSVSTHCTTVPRSWR